MTTSLLVSICCAIMAALVALLLARKSRISVVLKAKRHIELLMLLKGLLIYIQQHRGLTTGYLHGDSTLSSKVSQVSKQANIQWQNIKNTFPKTASEPLFEGIQSHWDRLSTRWTDHSVSNNIEQHGRLIINLLHLIENEAESQTVLVRFARDLGLDIIWRELLETIEAIGQTRAIGMGIVSAGRSTTVERIRIKFLIDKVNLRLEVLDKSFSEHSASSQSKVWSAPLLNTSRERVQELTVFIERYLLEEEKSEFSGEKFFGLATSAIEPLDALFDQASEHMKKSDSFRP